MKSPALTLLALVPALGVSAANLATDHAGWIDLNKNGKQDVYEDPAQPVPRRVADLLKRMTLAEKIGQLWQVAIQKDSDTALAETLRRGELGSCLDDSKLMETPVMRNKLQHLAVEQSRLGVPLIFGHDSIHGFRTIFPIPLAQACAWEPELFARTQAISARESAAAGVDWVFAPMVDLARDPRWGRIAEGFGEDPWLGALDAAASVRGFQGTNFGDPNRVVACLKHFTGYGAAEGGRDYNTTEISDYTLRNYYLPQYQAGVAAGAGTVMSSFNLLNGFPASGTHHTLTDILRGEMKFTGFVVSDWASVGEMAEHGVAATPADAARIGLTAGVDMEMVSTTYRTSLTEQVKTGTVSIKTVNEAVRRILTVKFKKGLFEHPYTDESLWQKANLHPDALALAREAAAKSCVLLKNDHATLPLAHDVKTIALIGPFADEADEMFGCWYSQAHAEDAVSLASGLRAKLSGAKQMTVVRGCALTEGGKPGHRLGDFSLISEPPTGSNEIAAAAALATNADVVILALGEPRDWSGEDGSRTELGVTGRQQELFDAVAATGKPVIVVLFNGRPLAVPRILAQSAAVLEAWYPGVEGGHGVADVLFGDVDPAGRLTTSVPFNVGQVPIHYNHFNTGRPGVGEYKGNYADAPITPLLPFGFGLTYTTFEYGPAELSPAKLKLGGTLTVKTKLKNTGARAGTEVVQLYLRALAATAGARPVHELKGFQKISMPAGAEREVSFTLPAKELGYYDAAGNWLVEPGRYQIWLAKDSASGAAAEFELSR